MPRLTADQIWRFLRNEGHCFFRIVFRRRTRRPDGTANPGDIRTMLCRTNVECYHHNILPPGHRDEEDYRCAVLTCWDIQAFQNNIRTGMGRQIAGERAYRRIDITSISECSILPEEDLPPDILELEHHITNEYRRNNMPRMPIRAR